jgi:hypothetical protein
MPFELWQKCADEIARVAPATHCWFSFCGEPLLEVELLLRMLGHGRSLGLSSLNVNTNGTLLGPDVVEPLLNSGAHCLVVGIDGFTRQTYEKIRIGGCRDEVYANVECLLAARNRYPFAPEVQVQFIQMQGNLHELDRFRDYWMDKGATVKVRRQLSWGGRFDTDLIVPERRRIPCPWAMTMMHLFWDGRVPRCPGDGEGDECVGSAWQSPLTELWKRLGTYRTLQLQRRFQELPLRCRECQDWMSGAAERIRP